MLKSMTGFGAGIANDGLRAARVEARAVNHRFLDIIFHLPRGLASLEDQLRKRVESRIFRGRIEIFATLEEFATRERTVKLDDGLLLGYMHALAKSEKLTGPLPLDLASIIAVPGIFTVEEVPVDPEVAPVLEAALDKALAELVAMRTSEGLRLEQDMLARMAKLRQWLLAVENQCPAVVESYRSRLQARIAELMKILPVDESRIALEVALFADKSCVAEECVRAASHIAHFHEACGTPGPVGRKLDFLLQELHREVSTLAVKSNDSLIAQHTVDMKAELEKVREQVQNIE